MWPPRGRLSAWQSIVGLGPRLGGFCPILVWVVGPFPSFFVWFCFTLCLKMHFVYFFYVSQYILLQMNNHQNLWNLLVINPNTKFSVYMGGFYVGIGGYF